jgi:hypothetical protein
VTGFRTSKCVTSTRSILIVTISFPLARRKNPLNTGDQPIRRSKTGLEQFRVNFPSRILLRLRATANYWVENCVDQCCWDDLSFRAVGRKIKKQQSFPKLTTASRSCGCSVVFLFSWKFRRTAGYCQSPRFSVFASVCAARSSESNSGGSPKRSSNTAFPVCSNSSFMSLPSESNTHANVLP